MRQLRCMRWPEGTFSDIMGEHYRSSSVRRYTVRDILVLYRDDGYALGWCIHFASDIPWLINRSGAGNSLGFWVRSTARGNGYGKLLVKEAHTRWAKELPRVFGKAEDIWRSL